ncbi:iron ABC transporter permease [Hyphomicrobium sp.]|uniref:FecCD family ABC transporter permease n=1 Tax=Hyphomicrobium sp. TaxID=82 RepID=UPI0025B94D21|nr:iron ABC transporter permease [Hyphomicrobium sp.]MCC7252430.1 iron ABC transporter permease [Hyphomicrobium sp.]
MLKVAPAGETAADATMRRRVRTSRQLLVLALILALAALLSLSVGPSGTTLLALPRVLAELVGYSAKTDGHEALVLLDIRLPRTLLAIYVGASLAIAGAMMQGLFRNPLADPGLIGVSSGAALAAVALIAFGETHAPALKEALGVHAVPIAAFVGGLAATAVLIGMTSGKRGVSTATLLLAGVAIAALTQALMGVAAYLSDDRALRDLTLWTLGSLAGASWTKVIGALPFMALLLILLPRLVRDLNGLLLGEAEAFHLGIDVRRAKLLIMLATAAAVGAAVAVAGIVGFVGIVTPHIVRLAAGPDHRFLLPASAMLGATLGLAADIVARMAVAPAELPLGIVTALIGAPFFLHLVLRRGVHG